MGRSTTSWSGCTRMTCVPTLSPWVMAPPTKFSGVVQSRSSPGGALALTALTSAPAFWDMLQTSCQQTSTMTMLHRSSLCYRLSQKNLIFFGFYFNLKILNSYCYKMKVKQDCEYRLKYMNA